MAKLNETIRKKDEQLFAEVRKLQANASGDYNRLYELSQKYIYKIIYDIVKDPYTKSSITLRLCSGRRCGPAEEPPDRSSG